MRGVETKKRKKKEMDRQMRIRVIVTMMMSRLQMKVMKMKNTTMSPQMRRKASAGMSLKSVLRRVSLLCSLLTTTTQRRSSRACALFLSLLAANLGVHSQRDVRIQSHNWWRNAHQSLHALPSCCSLYLREVSGIQMVPFSAYEWYTGSDGRWAGDLPGHTFSRIRISYSEFTRGLRRSVEGALA